MASSKRQVAEKISESHTESAGRVLCVINARVVVLFLLEHSKLLCSSLSDTAAVSEPAAHRWEQRNQLPGSLSAFARSVMTMYVAASLLNHL